MVAQPLYFDCEKCHCLSNSRRYSHCGITITFGVKYMPLHTYKTNYDPCTRQGGKSHYQEVLVVLNHSCPCTDDSLWEIKPSACTDT